MGRTENVAMLHHTLDTLRRGTYDVVGKPVQLKLSRHEMEQVQVFLPEDIAALDIGAEHRGADDDVRCSYSCENIDSFALARKRLEDGTDRILVLNLANPVNPGGGVYKGSQAQEEDLCRKSSLLISLESKAAQRYYDYNRSLNTFMGSDAIIITPQVEIIKDENGNMLEDSVIVSVMTCAAPMVTYGLEGLSTVQYLDMIYNRIVGMLKVAAHCGYRSLVLGAFGCGAFGNDAHVVSDIFADALNEFNFCNLNVDDLFDRIDFAVLDRTPEQYNFKSFNWHFAESL